MSQSMQQYQNLLVEPRVEFANLVNRLMSRSQLNTLEFFLLHHCVLGRLMTEQIGDWLNAAVNKSDALGYGELSRSLAEYRDIGFKRHELLGKDLPLLLQWINRRHQIELVSSYFHKKSVSEGVKKFLKLHEQVLKGKQPYRELAIQYEMERITMVHGYTLIQWCKLRFGKSVLRNLSAFRYQIKNNQQRTIILEQIQKQFIKKHPEVVDDMIEASVATLECYARYLVDCFDLAEQSVHKFIKVPEPVA